MTDEEIDEWMTRYDERPKLREVVLQLLADKRSLLSVARAANKASAIAPGICDEDVALEIALEKAKQNPQLKAEIEKRG